MPRTITTLSILASLLLIQFTQSVVEGWYTLYSCCCRTYMVLLILLVLHDTVLMIFYVCLCN